MLARQNLHLFRHKNTRFDVIGGVLYFCLVVSAVRPMVLFKWLPDVECWEQLTPRVCQMSSGEGVTLQDTLLEPSAGECSGLPLCFGMAAPWKLSQDVLCPLSHLNTCDAHMPHSSSMGPRNLL